MKNQTNNIVECAKKIRKIQSGQIDPLLQVIQYELSVIFPSLLQKDSDGVVDWSYDVINCESDEEVIKTLNRIDSIENKTWKCSFCGKDTYDVDIEYLSGYNHLECQLRNDINSVENQSLEVKLEQIVHQLNSLKEELKNLKKNI
jgi:hypothetical protein